MVHQCISYEMCKILVNRYETHKTHKTHETYKLISHNLDFFMNLTSLSPSIENNNLSCFLIAMLLVDIKKVYNLKT